MSGRRRRGDAINYERQQWRGPRQITPLPPSEVDVLIARVTHYAHAFELRWRLSALNRVDPVLAERFRGQVADWDAALKDTDEVEIMRQGRAMIRAWTAIIIRMEQAATVADDGYQLGYDRKTDTYVVISDHPADLAAARAQLGAAAKIMHLTPDDVAVTVDRLGPLVQAVFDEFPGAEIIDIREPTI